MISILNKKIKNIIDEIRKTVGNNKVIVAFSGGLDSTVAALLCKDALGPEKVELVNVVYGPFTYKKSIQIVKKAANKMGLKLTFLESLYQKEIWKNGPSCNMCTKSVKMNTVKNYAKDILVVTGSNQSDSWGKTGLKLFNGLYAPLGNLNKKEIKEILNYYSFKLERIGENAKREGCKLKHLLKIMTNMNYHGKAVDLANEILLENVPKNLELANVKIIGPLSKNIAIINVKPMVYNIEEIGKKIETLDVIDEVIIANKPLILKVLANPSIYRVENSKYWIEKGKLQPEFAVPIKVVWKESKNNKLRTIHVVGVEEWENFEQEKSKISLGTNLEIKNSCSLL
ncbi:MULTISPECIES: 7-cyano-7-deazaguanine synthase [unclassified Thermosipho (in: thermotogales)]|uniref:7-cyano-7-deazaguanine synthase n=1 Tax=unclassified Thermosipho (in: thermotogales) TaxID=2676525 RepID=UPI000952BE1D|nr:MULTISPECIES: 7-cyano-7-deazaguanine synthase [unclassified Thermosipho (in: thermotogales)]OOC42354.1 ExsB family protein [Thermosipho sp. 1074]